MVLLILAAVLALIILGVAKVISLPIALVGILLVLLIAGWRFDRGRRAGAPPPYKDANRPDFHGHPSLWQTPTPNIDHPDGGGEPPGVDRGDEATQQR